MLGQALTLSDLRAYDPYPSMCGVNEKSCCPLCGDAKPHDKLHQCFSMHSLTGLYYCHRCHTKGIINEYQTQGGARGRDAELEARLKQAEQEQHEKFVAELKRVGVLGGTPGEQY